MTQGLFLRRLQVGVSRKSRNLLFTGVSLVVFSGCIGTDQRESNVAPVANRRFSSNEFRPPAEPSLAVEATTARTQIEDEKDVLKPNKPAGEGAAGLERMEAMRGPVAQSARKIPAKRQARRAPETRRRDSIDDLLDSATGSKSSSRKRKASKSIRGGDGLGVSYGRGGLGLRGTGRGAGGSGYGTVGLGGSGRAIGADPKDSAGRFSTNGSIVDGELRSEQPNREGYAHIAENDFHEAKQVPLSTFSIDVDTASYANTRRYLTGGRKPPPSAVRIEEMINYFTYNYGSPSGDAPFAVHAEVTEAPWNPQHRLVHVGIQGKRIDMREAPASNLVFLLDVSGSMNSPHKLPLLVSGLSLLTKNLRERDRVAIVVYAGSSGLVLPSTSGAQKNAILSALERLRAGGSTNGAGGIELAYQVARKNFIRGGTNRVILATDGDFNVGVSSDGALARLIEKKRKSGVFLSVLGFGRGNLQDHKMETLADKGNGNYAYIDSMREAKKVLVREVGATLITIAKDVKIQVEFNPAKVKSYRLIGYENRKLAARDFNDDKKDAGEIGAGHTVTALYEVVPVGLDAPGGGNVDPLRYQDKELSAKADSGEMMSLKIRYKQPNAQKSKKLQWAIRDSGKTLAAVGPNERTAAALAAFGMLLRESKYKGDSSYALVKDLIRPTLASDKSGDRAELFHLINQAEAL